jgi:hypothetical protein
LHLHQTWRDLVVGRLQSFFSHNKIIKAWKRRKRLRVLVKTRKKEATMTFLPKKNVYKYNAQIFFIVRH